MTVDAGVKIEMVNVASDVSTMSTIGEVAIEAGADPGIENVTGSAGAKYGTEGTTDVTSTSQLIAACDVPPGGTFSMALPGSSLLR